MRNFVNRPICVLDDERVAVGGGVAQGREVVVGADVAENDADIPQPTVMFEAKDWRTAKNLAEFCVVPVQHLAQIGISPRR